MVRLAGLASGVWPVEGEYVGIKVNRREFRTEEEVGAAALARYRDTWSW